MHARSSPALWRGLALLMALTAGEVKAACAGSSPSWTCTPDFASLHNLLINNNPGMVRPGDTINVYAGYANWTNTLTITRGITLSGAGTGRTVITANGGTSFVIHYIPASPRDDVLFRVTGFTFQQASTNSLLHLEVSSPIIQYNIRFDHNEVTGTAYGFPTIWHEGPFWGVVDHNVFSGDPYFQNYGCFDGVSNWQSLTFAPGSRNSMYFEDNVFNISTSGTLFSTGNGGRFVFRYNTVNGSRGGFSGFYPLLDAHGNMGPGGNYGTMGTEVYGNLVTAPNLFVRLFDHRGGKSRVFNNLVLNSTGAELQIREEHADTQNPPANNVIDGSPQHVNDAYYWHNRHGTTPFDQQLAENTGTTPITANIDYFGWTNPYNGTSGTGIGTLAEMNAIRPTLLNTGFWATNDPPSTLPSTLDGLKSLSGTLYRWNGSAWVAHYSMYRYPHPLVAGAGAATPATPSGLTIR